VEVYNLGCATGADRPDGFHTLDQLLEEGRTLDLIATDDAHFSEPDHFGGWVMVKATENDPDALLEAMKSGHFYASQGPEIRNIVLTAREIVVECSAAVSIIILAQGNMAKAIHGHSMTRGTLPWDRLRSPRYIRVAIIDAAGRRAWSNPIWVTDL